MASRTASTPTVAESGPSVIAATNSSQAAFGSPSFAVERQSPARDGSRRLSHRPARTSCATGRGAAEGLRASRSEVPASWNCASGPNVHAQQRRGRVSYEFQKRCMPPSAAAFGSASGALILISPIGVPGGRSRTCLWICPMIDACTRISHGRRLSADSEPPKIGG